MIDEDVTRAQALTRNAIDNLWKLANEQLALSSHTGQASALKVAAKTYERIELATSGEESLRASLSCGECLSRLGRWDGKSSVEEAGVGKIAGFVAETEANDKNRDQKRQLCTGLARWGNALVRQGYLSCSQVFLERGEKRLDRALEFLGKRKDVADVKQRAIILRDRGDACVGEQFWARKIRIDDKAIDDLQASQRIFKGIDDLSELAATRSSLAIAHVIQARNLDDGDEYDAKKIPDKPAAIKASRQIARALIQDVLSIFPKAKANRSFRWARTISNIAFAAYELFLLEGRQDSKLAALSKYAFMQALQMYQEADHPFRRAINQEGLSDLLRMMSTKETPKRLHLAIQHLELAHAVYARTENVRAENAIKNLQILQKRLSGLTAGSESICTRRNSSTGTRSKHITGEMKARKKQITRKTFDRVSADEKAKLRARLEVMLDDIGEYGMKKQEQRFSAIDQAFDLLEIRGEIAGATLEDFARIFVPRIEKHEISQLENLLQIAQQETPPDPKGFKDTVNSILDATGLRIVVDERPTARLGVRDRPSRSSTLFLAVPGKGACGWKKDPVHILKTSIE